MGWTRRCAVVVSAIVLTGAVWSTSTEVARADAVPVVEPIVLGTVPHDLGAYSEGLEFDGPALYEATGLEGHSQLWQVDPDTGEVLRSVDLPPTYFGEGIAVVGDRIWQLTYKNEVAIEWDKASFTVVRELPYTGQGWGLCHDGARFVRSDGSGRLYFHDPSTFAQLGAVDVTRDGQGVLGLNELECVDRQVWAALWPTADQFVRIDPATGVVNLVLDATQLWPADQRNFRQVLSGIAHVGGDEYLISGKEWPLSYRVRIPGA